MENSIRFNISPRKGIFFSLVFLTLGFLLFLFLGVITTAIVTGNWDLTQILSPTATTPDGLISIRIMQMFQTAGMFIFPAVLIALLASKKPLSFLGFKQASTKQMLLAIAMMVILIPGINLIASLNADIPVPDWMIQMEKSAEELIKRLLITDKFSIFTLNLFMVAVLPAIGEELFFRSILQKYFIKLTNNNAWGIIITSLIFSAIHMQFLGFIPRFMLGVVFGYLYLWTGSIKVTMLVHFVNNGLAVFLYYLIGTGIAPMDIENIGEPSQSWYLGVTSLIFSGFLLWTLWNDRVKDRVQPAQTVEVL
ncbi:MAG: type II CAAX endopeptidase family protein [Bacteroidales bacterium]|mgnify:CR=1 FL=1|nr:type II CAAX endopeptidase family protein [Bacteroidales bacterium]MDD4384147.1 type II CAAX endopeptidase family protein [Bacteroidales bacterium]